MTLCHRVVPRLQQNRMSCWRACVDMILGYYGVTWQSEPGFGMPGDPDYRPPVIRSQYHPTDPYTPTHARSGDPTGPQTLGVMNFQFGDMAAHYGFEPLTNDRIHTWTPAGLERCLRRCGPLWYGVQMPFNHVVVVTGVDAASQRVSVNDPAFGRKTFWPLAQFNQRIVDTASNPLFYPSQRDGEGRPVFGRQVRRQMPFDHVFD